MSKFKDKFGNEYANEALLKLNEFFQALKELPNADKILNIKGQFIEKGYIIKNKRK